MILMTPIKYYVGIDYSLTCPAVCIFSPFEENQSFALGDCKIHFYTKTEKYTGKWAKGIFIGKQQPEAFKDELTRYRLLAHWVGNTLKNHTCATMQTKIYLEGYSMGSKGKVFNIAENTGLLKHILDNDFHYQDIISVPPTTIKQFATTKGNADKEKMQDAFISETGVDVKKLLDISPKQWNPSSDIIDAYFISKFGYHQRLIP